MLTLDKRFTISLPLGSISEEGKRLISHYIDTQNLRSDLWQSANPTETRVFLPNLPFDWAWEWVIKGRGEYVGTFPKRASKFYWQVHNLKCPNAFVQELGNLARQHSSDSVTYEFDFVNQFNWISGDFGDKHSCFWGSRDAARQILTDNNALAMRFYKDDSGIARAWLAQLSDNRFIIFNGYGFQANSTLTIARVLATYLGLSYKRIALENFGKNDGTLWINSGIGYLISTSEQAENISEYDLEFQSQSEDLHECYSCGNTIHEDDSYNAPNDEIYCQDCFYETFAYCEHCGEADYREDMSYIDNVGDVCESCVDRRYTYCNRCYEYHPNDSVIEVEGDYFCDNCAEKVATTCEECEKWILLENAYSDENGTFCEDCKPKDDIED
jgi:hypothetical protein